MTDWRNAMDLPFDAQPVPSPLLVFSDNPEVIGSSHIPGVLWSYEHLDDAAAERSFRVVAWHVNESSAAARIGITLQNLGLHDSDALIVARGDAAAQLDTTNMNYFTPGKCIAKAALGRTLDAFLPHDLTINAGSPGEPSRPVAVLERAIAHRRHFFCCCELTIRRLDGAAGRMHFKLRTGVHRSDTTACTSAPFPAHPADGDDLAGHARGTWAYSKLRIRMTEPYTVGSGSARMRLADRIWGADACTPDGELFRSRGNLHDEAGAGSKANKGMYGVDYDPVEVQVRNPTGQERRVRVSVGTQIAATAEPGHQYKTGLVGAMSDARGFVRGVPTNDQIRMCWDGDDGPNTVPALDLAVPPGETVTGAFRFHVGGNSSTAWWVVFHDLP